MTENDSVILLFLFGVIAMAVRVVLAVYIPEPNQNQETVFRTVLSISCAGIAAIVPGSIEFSSEMMKTTISATGAIGVFAFVYLTNPNAKKIISSIPRTETNLETLEKRIAKLENTIESNRPSTTLSYQSLKDEAFITTTKSNELASPVQTRQARVPILISGVATIIALGFLIIMLIHNPNENPFDSVLNRMVLGPLAAVIGFCVPSIAGVQGISGWVIKITCSILLLSIVWFITPAIN